MFLSVAGALTVCTYSFASDIISMPDSTSYKDTLASSKVEADLGAKRVSSSPLMVVDSKQIERRGAFQLHEVVRTLAGVSVKDYGGIGGLKTVSVRNLGSAHTIVCYDGFTVSDAQNGQVDISRFLLENVSSISVSIGPSDDIFRSARSTAASGVLSIRTNCLSQKEPHSVRSGLSAGCFNTWNPYIHYGARLKSGLILSADANFLHSDGDYPFLIRNGSQTSIEKRLNSDVNTLNSEINLSVPVGRNDGQIRAKAGFFRSERGLPGGVVLYWQDPTERLWDRNISANIRYEDTFGSIWKLEVNCSYVNAWNKYVDDNPVYQQAMVSRYLQHEAGLGAIAGCTLGKHWFLTLAQDLYCNILDSDIPECPYPQRLTSQTALSARFRSGRLTLTGTISGTLAYERLRKKIDGTEASGPMKRLSPSLSAMYSLLDDGSLKLRASVKDGFRMPTFNDLYYSRVGNSSLLPEKAFMSNIGAEWRRERCRRCSSLGFDLSADLYYNRVRDKITAIPTMFIWKMRNIGTVNMFGADIAANLRWEMSKRISIDCQANYSYQHAIDVTDPSAKNFKHQIPYTPRHSGNLILSAETFWVTASYTLTCCSERYALPQNIPSNLIKGYMDHGISLSRTFNLPGRFRIHASLQALNLSGTNYEIIKNYPMSGRSFRIGLKITY